MEKNRVIINVYARSKKKTDTNYAEIVLKDIQKALREYPDSYKWLLSVSVTITRGNHIEAIFEETKHGSFNTFLRCIHHTTLCGRYLKYILRKETLDIRPLTRKDIVTKMPPVESIIEKGKDADYMQNVFYGMTGMLPPNS